METSDGVRTWSLPIAILALCAVLALVAWLVISWQAAVIIMLVASPIAAYVYAGWERAWGAGLVSAVFLAFVVGGSLASPEEISSNFFRGGLWATIPTVVGIWMAFAAARQLLIVWRCGDRQRTWRLLLGFIATGYGRFRGLFPGLQGFFSIQIISKGEMIYSSPPSKSIRMLGPGIIVLDSGNAVVLEKNGKITRIAGPGIVKTQPFEVILAIVDLRVQKKTLQPTAELLTRDGIPIKVTATVWYRILGDDSALVEEARYNLDERAIRKAVLRAADWKEQTELVAKAALRDVIAEHRLNQIVYHPRALDHQDRTGPMAPRVHLQEKVRAEADRQCRAWGVEIVRVTLDEISIPDAVKQRLLDYWDLDWHATVETFRTMTEVKAMLMKAQGQGEAEAIKTISEVLTRLNAVSFEQEISKGRAVITGIEARARAEAEILDRRSAAIAEAERFQRVLGAIQDIAGREKMAEFTQEMIRVLTSVNDVQAVVRILGMARRPLLTGSDGHGVEEPTSTESSAQGGHVTYEH